MDAAEGDGGRSAAASERATGWRVPSVERTRSGLPLDWHEDDPDRVVPVVALPLPTEIEPSPPTGEIDEPTEPAPPSRRRWSLRRRRRDPEPVDSAEPSELDLVALANEDEQMWSDAALAALEEPGVTGSVTAAAVAEVFTSGRGDGGPWSELAEEVQVRELQAELRARAEHDDPTRAVGPIDTSTELTSSAVEPARLELEDEFWAEGSTMSPGWLQRRKHREEQEAGLDEPMEMLDLSAYDVPPERRGAFRDAVAAGTDAETEPAWAKTARDLPS